jgi:hypothetical protein
LPEFSTVEARPLFDLRCGKEPEARRTDWDLWQQAQLLAGCKIAALNFLPASYLDTAGGKSAIDNRQWQKKSGNRESKSAIGQSKSIILIGNR